MSQHGFPDTTVTRYSTVNQSRTHVDTKSRDAQVPHIKWCAAVGPPTSRLRISGFSQHHRSCFRPLATVNCAAVNIRVQVSVWVFVFSSLGHIPRSGNAVPPVFVNTVVQEHSRMYLLTSWLHLNGEWAAVKETTCPTEPTTYSIWTFTEKRLLTLVIAHYSKMEKGWRSSWFCLIKLGGLCVCVCVFWRGQWEGEH